MGSTYTVHAGDTLQGIAQALWGDAQMWYLLADANHLSGAEALSSGQVLLVPNKVTNIHNNAGTFRPYNPGEVIGNISPTAPPPPKHGSSALKILVIVAIAVVATVATAGALAGASGTALFSEGAAVLAGTSTAAAVSTTSALLTTAATAGAVGSAVSQLAAMAMGVQDSFSWSSVGKSAIGSGMGAWLGQVANAGAATNSAVQAGTTTTAAATSSTGSLSSWYAGLGTTTRAVVQGGLSNALQNQLISGKFSWRQVVASSVAGGLSSYLNGPADASNGFKTDLGTMGRQVAASLTSGWASSAIVLHDSKLTNSKANLSNLFASSLGTLVGNAFVEDQKAQEDAAQKQFAQNAANNRTMLNAAERAMDSEPAGSGLKLRPGSDGLRFSPSAVSAWSSEIDQGIKDQAQAQSNWDKAFGRYSAKLDAEAAERAQAELPRQHARADAYGRGLAAAKAKAANFMSPDQVAATYAAYGGRSSLANVPSASTVTSPSSMVESAQYDFLGNYTGVALIQDFGPSRLSYGESVGKALAATAEMGYGIIKGWVNGVPEMAVSTVKGWAYIGAGLRDAYDSLTGSPAGNYLSRAINAGNSYSGEVWSYGDSGLQRMGGFAGELASPWAYGKAISLGGTAFSAILENAFSGPLPGSRASQLGGVDFGDAGAAGGTGRTGLIDIGAGRDFPPGFYRADPAQLRFTQSDASPFFSKGGTIDSLVSDLRSGKVTADQVGDPLQVVMHDGLPFSIDNRRLVAFNLAGVKDVPIQVMSLEDQVVATRFFDRFDPIGGVGQNIVITPSSGRTPAQLILRDAGLIKGVQLDH